MDTNKDFDKWNELKKYIQTDIPETFCWPREIWMCSFGLNIGTEIDGKDLNFSRPVLVISLMGSTFLGIPITSQNKSGKYIYKFNLGGIDQFAKFSQTRALSTKRLQRKVAVMPESQFFEIIRSFIASLPKNEIPLAGEISEA